VEVLGEGDDLDATVAVDFVALDLDSRLGRTGARPLDPYDDWRVARADA